MDFDVVIAGGGPAGAATSLGLCRAGRRVLLCEQGPCSGARWKAGEGLPAASRRMLAALGVDVETLLAPHRRSLGSQSLWGSSTLQTSDALRDPDGTGWHLDRARFDRDLLERASESGAEVRWETRVRDVERIDGGWRISVVNGDEESSLTARWWVDATGRAGRLAAQTGARAAALDSLVAFSVVAEPESEQAPDDPDAMTLVESAPDGWWYTACLPNRRRVVVFLTDSDLEAAAAARSIDGFRTLLSSTREIRERLEKSAWHLSGPHQSGRPRGGPAATVRRQALHGDGWLAVGDAAAAFDPLSSQGIFTALYGGLKAAEALDASLDGDADATGRYAADLGRVLSAYDVRRRAIYGAETRFSDRAFWSRRRPTAL